jgi:hypothetical protein
MLVQDLNCLFKNNSGDVVWQNSGGIFNASTSTVVFNNLIQNKR